MSRVNRSIAELKDSLNRIFLAYGLSESASKISSDVMATSEAVGLSSHGIQTLEGHLSRLKNFQYNIKPKFDIIRKAPSFCTFDGDNAIGYQSASHSMQYAIDQAKKIGLFTVFSKNNNTFGPGFYYAKLAADQGLIGIAISNSPPAMAPWNGKDQLLGTNPFAMGIPVPKEDPILFDMASSKVAKSKIKPFLDSDMPIPDNWALNKEGQPTNDPLEAINGLMLPMAEHKGSGIAMMIDILAGVISGAAFLNHVNRFYCDSGNSMNVGFCMIALDPDMVLGKEYAQAIAQYRSAIISSSPINDAEPVRLPGENKFKMLREALEKGISIEESKLSTINAILKSDEKSFKI